MRYYNIILTFIGAVSAGSYIWQPQITRYDHLGIDHTDYNTSIYPSIRALSKPPPVNVHSLSKRFLFLSSNYPQKWPNKNVPYCFKTSQDRDALKDLTEAAFALWQWSGLDSSFSHEEVNEERCSQERATLLLISRSTATSATLGFIPSYPSMGGYGPALYYDDTETGTFERKRALFAHEIGHVWGLFHEHQNPAFWKPQDGYVQALPGGDVFGDNNFHCEKLQGFAEVEARAQVRVGADGTHKMCHDWNFAQDIGFTAAFNWLPVPSIFVHTWREQGKTSVDVDWQSIMMYESYSAGIPGDRHPVATHPDGTIIAFPKYPSVLDVWGINTFYKGAENAESLTLLSLPASSMHGKFMDVYSSSRGDKACQLGG